MESQGSGDTGRGGGGAKRATDRLFGKKEPIWKSTFGNCGKKCPKHEWLFWILGAQGEDRPGSLLVPHPRLAAGSWWPRPPSSSAPLPGRRKDKSDRVGVKWQKGRVHGT